MKQVFALGVILLIIKFLAYAFTGSTAILTDALESIINVMAAGFALFSAYYASKPRDLDHPYGHGKIEYLSAGFEGGLIFIAGLSIIIKSVWNLYEPTPIDRLDVGIYLSVFAGLCNLLIGNYLVAQGKKHHSALLVADGKHLLSDTWSSAGLVLGLILIALTGQVWIDSVLAIALGIFVVHTGYKLLLASVRSLLDEADYIILQEMLDIINQNRRSCWIDIHNLRLLKYGSLLHVDCHLTLPAYFSLIEAHDEVKAIEELVNNNMQGRVEFFIHVDPCVQPDNCKVCLKADCSIRASEFEKRIPWKLENLLPNKKHTA